MVAEGTVRGVLAPEKLVELLTSCFPFLIWPPWLLVPFVLSKLNCCCCIWVCREGRPGFVLLALAFLEGFPLF